jgi:hypothetical protein
MQRPNRGGCRIAARSSGSGPSGPARPTEGPVAAGQPLRTVVYPRPSRSALSLRSNLSLSPSLNLTRPPETPETPECRTDRRPSRAASAWPRPGQRSGREGRASPAEPAATQGCRSAAAWPARPERSDPDQPRWRTDGAQLRNAGAFARLVAETRPGSAPRGWDGGSPSSPAPRSDGRRGGRGTSPPMPTGRGGGSTSVVRPSGRRGGGMTSGAEGPAPASPG